MRTVALALCAISFVVVGCNRSSDDDTPVKPTTMANPSGKPQNEQQAAQLSAQQQAGESAKRRMADAAAEMKAAQARTGGK